jgi:aspartyl-tRNA(Asn)/glutamyl-tRNA(Gln) amidotransferase subunit A
VSATIQDLAAALRSAAVGSRALVEECLERAQDPAGEGSRTFVQLDADSARRAAGAVDAARRAGSEQRPWAGIPLSVKDLFDVAGQVTRAGSVVLADAAPAVRDADAVARLKSAGFVIVGRTNMTEFA